MVGAFCRRERRYRAYGGEPEEHQA
jgi:hypothetical protein